MKGSGKSGNSALRESARAVVVILLVFVLAINALSSLSALSHSSGKAIPETSSFPWNVVLSSDTTLTGDLFCGNLTIASGVTLYTDGYSIFCEYNLQNSGTIVTGNGPYGNLTDSYGGSGGGAASQATNAGSSAGFSTIYPGGTGSSTTNTNANNGENSLLTSVSSSLIKTWFQENFTNYLTGAAGENSSGILGGLGSNGVYIQANSITVGTISAYGAAGSGTGSGVGLSGGGGGGIVILSYGSGGLNQAGSSVVVTGGSGVPSAAGTQYSGTGGNGSIINYSYGSTAPINFTSTSGEVIFSESGLPQSTSWNITIGSSQLLNSSTNSIHLFLKSGVYQYSVNSTDGLLAGNGTVSVVAGTSTIVPVNFTSPTYNVSFHAQNLTKNSQWSVYVDNTSLTPSGNSTHIMLHNGTYSYYSVEMSGQNMSTSPVGHLTVSGTNVSVNLSFGNSYKPSSGSFSQFQGDPGHNGYVGSMGPQAASVMWNSSIAGYPYESLIAASGTVYMSVYNQEYGYLYGVNNSDGKSLFTAYTSYTGSGDPTSLASYYSASGDGMVFSYDYCIGCWLSDGPWLIADNATTGNNVWQINVGGLSSSSSLYGIGTVSFYNNTVFLTYVNQSAVYAFNAYTGASVWTFNAAGKIDTVPTFIDGQMILGFSNISEIQSFYVDGSGLAWESPIDNTTLVTPSASNNSVFVTSLNGTLYRFALNGRVMWEDYLDQSVRTTPAEAFSSVYLITSAGNLTSFYQSNGTIKWYKQLGSTSAVSPIISSNGILYAADKSTVFAFDARTGSKLWSYSIPSGLYSSMLLFDGVLYVPSQNGTITAFGSYLQVNGIPSHLTVPFQTDLSATNYLNATSSVYFWDVNGHSLKDGRDLLVYPTAAGSYNISVISIAPNGEVDGTAFTLPVLYNIQLSILGSTAPAKWGIGLSNGAYYQFNSPNGNFNLSNGEYNYSISVPSGYTLGSQQNGTILVDGSSVYIDGTPGNSYSFTYSQAPGNTTSPNPPGNNNVPPATTPYSVFIAVAILATIVLVVVGASRRHSSNKRRIQYSSQNSSQDNIAPPPVNESQATPPPTVGNAGKPAAAASAGAAVAAYQYEKGDSIAAVIGYSGLGKSVFLTLFVYAAAFINEIPGYSFVLESISPLLRDSLKDLLSGKWPSGTRRGDMRTQTSISISKKTRFKTRKVDLALNDASGETWADIAENGETPALLRQLIAKYPQVSYLEHTSSYLITINSENHLDWPTEQFNYLNLLKAIYFLNGKKKVKKPVALVFTKFDQLPPELQNSSLESILKTDFTHVYHYLLEHFTMEKFALFGIGIKVDKKGNPNVVLRNGQKSLEILGGTGPYGSIPEIVKWMLAE